MTKISHVYAYLMMPPPIHGASTINQLVIEKLRNAGAIVHLNNTVPSRFNKFFPTISWKILRTIHVFGLFLKTLFAPVHSNAVYYFGISGGPGLLFDILLAVAVRLRPRPIFIHHHSFAYISFPSRYLRMLLNILYRDRLTHIVLCDAMKVALCEQYADLISPQSVIVVSNAAVLLSNNAANNSLPSLDVTPDVPSKTLRLGYISNITVEKGIFEAIETFEACIKAGLDVTFTIAGPCNDEGTMKRVKRFADSSSSCDYIGPIYGEIKRSFFNSIDILLFPSRYANEAEPLVIFEAAAAGVPCISTSRGCIPSLVGELRGWLVQDTDAFSDIAVQIISDIERDNTFHSSRHARVENSQIISARNSKDLENLIKAMTANKHATIR